MKDKKTSFVHWLILALLGLFLIIGHSLAQDIICKIIGVALILSAVSGIAEWWKEKSKAPEAIVSLLGRVLIVLLGLWIVLNTGRFISLINVVIGIVIIAIGAVNLYSGWKLHQVPHMVLAALAIALGVVVICCHAATSVPVICQGIGLIYTAAVGYLGDRNKA